MIRTLRELPADLQWELLALFSPEDLGVSDEDLWPRLIEVLKQDVLHVSEATDLGEALRRRLVEVAVERLGVLSQKETDSMTDIEIAASITGYLVRVTGEVETNEDLKRFFRTKSRRQKAGALRGAALTSEAPVEADAEGEQDGSVYGEILESLGPGATRSSLGHDDQEDPVTRWSTLPGLATVGPVLSALSYWKKAGIAAPTALGSTSGAAFMAGLRPRFDPDTREMVLVKDEAEVQRRSNRARNSRMVQKVSTLAAFVIASVGDRIATAHMVGRYLESLGRDFEKVSDTEFQTQEGSATITIGVHKDGERSVVTLRSPLVSGVSPTREDLVGLLESNDRLNFAKFGWDSDAQAIYAADELLGDTLDADELGNALNRVARLADEGDDKLREHFSEVGRKEWSGDGTLGPEDLPTAWKTMPKSGRIIFGPEDKVTPREES